MTRKQINDFIDNLIKENGTSDPFKICTLNNLEVMYHCDSFKGICVKLPTNEIFISLRDNLNGFDKYFTICHEIYHALVDFKNDHTLTVLNFSKESCVCEKNANYFAYRLLQKMDPELIESICEETEVIDNNIDKLIKDFASREL